MGLKKLAPIVAAALLGTFVFAAVADAGSYHPDTSRIYRIVTEGNFLALDVSGASLENDVPVIQWPVNGGTNQEWRFVPAGSGEQYEIVNVGSGKCLSVYYNSLDPGGKLVQYVCHAWADQRWYLDNPWGNIVKLYSQSSLLYASVPGNSPWWGTQLIQWPNASWDSSEFFIPIVIA